MPGLWFLPREDEGAWKGLPAARGDYLELRLLDSTWHPHGMALVRVEEREDPARYGEWFPATISGRGGSPSTSVPRALLLAGAPKGTPTWSSTSSPRSIPLVELGTPQQPAWLGPPAAAADLKWELDRLGGQPPQPAAAENKGGRREKKESQGPCAAPSWAHPGRTASRRALPQTTWPRSLRILAGVGRISGRQSDEIAQRRSPEPR